MASSKVQICSNALLMLGAQPINSFDDNTDRALLVSNLWDNMRDAILRSHPWNCAIKRVALAAEVAAPAFDYTYQFLLPADCLRILSVGEQGDPVDYQLEGRLVLCDDSPLYLRYLYRNTDIASWDALLVQAAEAYVAMTCAYPVTKSTSQTEAMAAFWKLKLQQARTIDGQENPPEEAGDYPFLNARRR